MSSRGAGDSPNPARPQPIPRPHLPALLGTPAGAGLPRGRYGLPGLWRHDRPACFFLYVPSPSLRKIFRIDREGAVEHIAGTGASGTADGPALEATFGRPNSIAAGPDGQTFYIIDADAQSVRVLYLESDTAVDDGPSTGTFTLDPLYPNPSNGVSNIRFSINRAWPVRLTLPDLLGSEVAVVVDDVPPAGTYERLLNASGLSAGVYTCRLTSGGRSAVRLITLVQ